MTRKITTDIVASAMQGKGRMTTREIYKAINKRGLSSHWRSTVRNTLQRHCRKNSKFIKPNLFVHHGRGVWECRQ